jgi:hypothetical protein
MIIVRIEDATNGLPPFVVRIELCRWYYYRDAGDAGTLGTNTKHIAVGICPCSSAV